MKSLLIKQMIVFEEICWVFSEVVKLSDNKSVPKVECTGGFSRRSRSSVEP